MILPREQGIYCVVFNLPKLISQDVGMLGMGEFLPGIYFYCGSAKGKGGIKGRVGRHLTKGTRKHWHIDYIKEYFEPISVWFVTNRNMSECDLVGNLQKMGDFQPVLRGFGASDCTQHCFSHLLFSSAHLDMAAVFADLMRSFIEIKQMNVKSEPLIR